MNNLSEGSNLIDVTNFNQLQIQIPSADRAKLTKSSRTLKQSDILRPEIEQNDLERMEIEEKVPYDEIRMRLPTVWDQYRFLVDIKNIYLPKWDKINKKPKWATEKYLVGVMLNRIFSLKIEQIKKPPPVTKKKKKGQMLQILEQFANKPLGFEVEREPQKKWLIKMIYSLDQNNEIFRPAIQEIKKTIPIELKLL